VLSAIGKETPVSDRNCHYKVRVDSAETVKHPAYNTKWHNGSIITYKMQWKNPWSSAWILLQPVIWRV